MHGSADFVKPTMGKSAVQSFGTNGYALREMHFALRDYARTRRQARFDVHRRTITNITWGIVLGTRSALLAVGAITPGQYDRIGRRSTRILNAEVTRRPLAELRAAA